MDRARFRKRVGVWLAVAVALLAGGCTFPRAGDGARPDRGDVPIRVVASIYPYADLARQVAGGRAEVVTLVPAGAEPHGWEPRAGDIRALNQAHLFIFNGAGLEPWADKVLRNLDNPRLVTLEATAGLELISGDPHIWLDPVLLKEVVARIRDALIRVDPAGREVYAAGAAALVADLEAIDREYRLLSGCRRREVVITHAFFTYPAARYGLRQVPIAGLSPEAEPTPGQLARLVAFVREHQVRYIFFETLVSDKVARLIAEEAGAETLVLNPIEGLTPAEEAQGKHVQDLLRENLRHLRIGLECGA